MIKNSTTNCKSVKKYKHSIIFFLGRRIETGDILAIEYAAFVKGNKNPFAKGSREQFIVKDGSLIKGWDIAIESMRSVIISTSWILVSTSWAINRRLYML